MPAGTTIAVTVTTGVTDVDGNPLATPFTSRFTTAGTLTAPGVALGEVYDDTRSLPLAGAMVDVLALDTGAVLSSSVTDARGQYLLAPGQVNVLVRITRPGFATVERQTTTAHGAFAEVLDARLTR